MQRGSGILSVTLDMESDALTMATESGKKEERPILSTRGYNQCFGIIVVEFKFDDCHPDFDVINAPPHGEEEIWDLMTGRRFLELRVIGV